MDLSKREADAFEFIRDHIAKHGRSPYQHEITAHFNWGSRAFTCRMLNAMASKGAIAMIPHVPGSITIPKDKARTQIAISLRDEIRDALDLISKAEGSETSTIIAEWISERVVHELHCRAKAA